MPSYTIWIPEEMNVIFFTVPDSEGNEVTSDRFADKHTAIELAMSLAKDKVIPNTYTIIETIFA